ncbi:uncharacterized protein BX664DRAFT_386080 [Halteromyces radiatus]|uniref:uncharacterized protein n=1 Tax=Halteromyces radiatus TaxID=101107 RepID=UPI0022200C72|nr:uncharacterized protein BX664DRAFT_386080 [Halteromyces radiatus]KAI8089620.1 hypothetical protein BX664DRAFT_386080 [Halteromyces radiatus]
MPLHSQQMPYNRKTISYILPEPDLDSLLQLASVLSDTKQKSQIEKFVACFRQKKYIGKLLDIFEQCEQQIDLSNIRTLRGIFNTLLLWADINMIQEFVLETHIKGVLRVLELTSKKSLSYHEQFEQFPRMNVKNILPKQLGLKIRQIENLEFFKTRVAPQYKQKSQIISAIDQLIWWYHCDIVNWLQQDNNLIYDLFNKLKYQENQLLIIKFLCLVFGFASKDMQRFAGISFFRILAEKGLLNEIQYLLSDDDHSDIRNTAAGLLHIAIQLDSGIVQEHILIQAEKYKHQQPNLLQVILEQLTKDEDDFRLKQQLFDLVKIILGIGNNSSNQQQSLSTPTPQTLFGDDPRTGNILKLFYERYATLLLRSIHSIQVKSVDLVNPVENLIMDPDQILFYGNLCEFLQSMILHYGGRTKRILHDPRCFANMVQLLRCQDPLLKIQTLRFFRAAIGMRDMEMNAMMIEQNVFILLVRLFLDVYTQPDSTLYSECLDVFEFIQLRGSKEIVNHIMGEYGSILEPVVTLRPFNLLKLKYDKNLESMVDNSIA